VTVDRLRLPEPGAVRPFTFPSITKSVLPGGLRVWSVRHAAVPVTTFVLLLKRGSASDPAGQEGLSALTVDMLDEGSGHRTAIEMHEALANVGAQFDTDIGADAAAATMTALGRFAGRGLTLVADMIARPALTEADFQRVRQLRLHRLTQLRDVPGAVADRIFIKLLYGPHPYGHTSMGTETSLAALTIDDVRSFHARSIRPDVATLVAVGDCDHSQIEAMAAEAFAGWQSAPDLGGAPVDPAVGVEALPPGYGDDAPAGAPRLFIVPRPGAPQSELRIGHVGVARATPDYHPLVAANMILGGQFVSRINLNLREDKGFTYGARTAFDFRRMPGPFSLQVSVQTAATARAIEESLGEIAAIRGPRPATAEELGLGVAALTRGYARNFETAEQIARAATQIALYDLPDDYFVQFVPNVERVTTADVTRAVAAHLHPDRLVVLVIGDLEAVGEDLQHLGLGDPVVLSAESF
jgi:zinc protease